MLGRIELLELLLLLARCSDGSDGLRPLDFAKRFKISVSDTTPVRRPERCAPGSAAAGTDEEKPGLGSGEGGTDVDPEVGGTITVGVMPPVPAALPMLVGTPNADMLEDVLAERTG